MTNEIDNQQAERLAKELSELSHEQSEAFQEAAFIKMSPEEAAAFDERRKRISEVCTLLGKFRPF